MTRFPKRATLLPVLALILLAPQAPALAGDCADADVAFEDGETLDGTLSKTDAQLDDESRFDLFSFSGDAGEWITITMKATDFNPYIYNISWCGDEDEYIEIEELSADTTVAVISLALPHDGDYTCRANSIDYGEGNTGFGNYTIQLTYERSDLVDAVSDDGGLSAIETEMCDNMQLGRLVPGVVSHGTLDESDPIINEDDPTALEFWRFTAQTGKTYKLTMKSDEISPWIYGIYNCETNERIDYEDTSETTDLVTFKFTVPSDGTWIIKANALVYEAEDSYGDYTLKVEVVD